MYVCMHGKRKTKRYRVGGVGRTGGRGGGGGGGRRCRQKMGVFRGFSGFKPTPK